MKILEIYLYLVMCVFILIGLTGLIVPIEILREVHLDVPNIAGLGEIRSLYGAFLAYAFILYRGVSSENGRLFLLAIGPILALLALGRGVRLALDGFHLYTMLLLVIEITTTTACLAIARSGR